MFLSFCLKIFQVNVALFITLDNDDFHGCHHRAGRIGPVCGTRDQADVSLAFAAMDLVSMNQQ